jgi:hypothetical protein
MIWLGVFGKTQTGGAKLRDKKGEDERHVRQRQRKHRARGDSDYL